MDAASIPAGETSSLAQVMASMLSILSRFGDSIATPEPKAAALHTGGEPPDTVGKDLAASSANLVAAAASLSKAAVLMADESGKHAAQTRQAAKPGGRWR